MSVSWSNIRGSISVDVTRALKFAEDCFSIPGTLLSSIPASILLARDKRSRARKAESRKQSSPGDRSRKIVPRLSASDRHRYRRHHRAGSPGSMAALRARPGHARCIHSRRRKQRPHYSAGGIGSEDGLLSDERVAGQWVPRGACRRQCFRTEVMQASTRSADKQSAAGIRVDQQPICIGALIQLLPSHSTRSRRPSLPSVRFPATRFSR